MGAQSLHRAPLPIIKEEKAAKKRGEREKGEGKIKGDRSHKKRASRQEICKGRRREKR